MKFRCAEFTFRPPLIRPSLGHFSSDDLQHYYPDYPYIKCERQPGESKEVVKLY